MKGITGVTMPRFFINAVPQDGLIPITGEDAHHIIRVLRMKIGETLIICDSAGHDYICSLQRICKEEALCKVERIEPSAGEPHTLVTLYMGLPKGDKMDFIVQKAVELGAAEIMPFAAARSVSRPESNALHKKYSRWRKIARDAAMQCGRGRIPAVGELISHAQAVQDAAGHDIALFLNENETQRGIRQVLGNQQVQRLAVMVGPEGGFAPEEVGAAVAAGMDSVSLGPRILRCETAPLAALSIALYETEYHSFGE